MEEKKGLIGKRRVVDKKKEINEKVKQANEILTNHTKRYSLKVNKYCKIF